jgi:hypothetical protein
MGWLRWELFVVVLAVGSQSAGVSATRHTNSGLSTARRTPSLVAKLADAGDPPLRVGSAYRVVEPAKA